MAKKSAEQIIREVETGIPRKTYNMKSFGQFLGTIMGILIAILLILGIVWCIKALILLIF